MVGSRLKAVKTHSRATLTWSFKRSAKSVKVCANLDVVIFTFSSSFTCFRRSNSFMSVVKALIYISIAKCLNFSAAYKVQLVNRTVHSLQYTITPLCMTLHITHKPSASARFVKFLTDTTNSWSNDSVLESTRYVFNRSVNDPLRLLVYFIRIFERKYLEPKMAILWQLRHILDIFTRFLANLLISWTPSSNCSSSN